MTLTHRQQTLLAKALVRMPNGAKGLSQADYAKELQSVWDWAKLTGASEERIIEEIIDTLSESAALRDGNTRGRGFSRVILEYDGTN